MKLRKADRWGEGHFGASRDGGKRTHKGVDVVSQAGYPVFSPVTGEVTKIGYPYSHHQNYRYVEVTNGDYRYRVFYVNPIVKVGDIIQQGLTIGLAQDLNIIYKEITDHVHFEIIDKHGNYIDPTPVIIALESCNQSIV